MLTGALLARGWLLLAEYGDSPPSLRTEQAMTAPQRTGEGQGGQRAGTAILLFCCFTLFGVERAGGLIDGGRQGDMCRI